MATSVFTIKQNDTSEDLHATLNDSVETAFSLVGCTVVFNMRSLKTGSVKINRASASIVDATTREVKYVWVTGDTDTAGDFEGEFEVTFTDGKILTFPNGLHNNILIHIPAQIA